MDVLKDKSDANKLIRRIKFISDDAKMSKRLDKLEKRADALK